MLFSRTHPAMLVVNWHTYKCKQNVIRDRVIENSQ